MLPTRTGTILKSIVEQYIAKAVPVPSQSIVNDSELRVSPATIRNEMAYLEQEGYIIRPHTSAGSLPSDKGYRYYVESLENVKLPLAEQHLISHLLHQVEKEAEKWLSLTATILSQLGQNVAVVTMPKPADCKFKLSELVALQDSLALAILVLHGAKVKQKLITFDHIVLQPRLTATANKLNATYSGLTSQRILDKDLELSPIEQYITDHLVEMMQAEDKQEYEEPYLDGLLFTFNQPEFTHSHRMQALMELIEHRHLLEAIIPEELNQCGMRIIIGSENKTEAFHNYSVVISQYGLSDEATGIIGVLGPTRMPYAHTIPTVEYLSQMLNRLVAALYGRETPSKEG